MKTTFDLPDPLVRMAKSLAARQGRPLRDLVAEAIGDKLDREMGAITESRPASEARRKAFESWKSRLVLQPDGTYFNPDGIEDESFFESLEKIRLESWAERDPFAAKK